MRSLIILLVLLSAPGLALAQAGRFLLAVGDVVVARGQDEIRAATGTEVQSGDTIRVGPASNAQIRLTDESIVGLRPGTIFRLDEFAYSGQGDGNERSLFTLLKGGFRTVTGAIGRLHSRERYAVRTPTATIGIRGTHYTVVHCDNDCGTLNRVSLAALDSIAQSDAAPGVGQSIPNGTYGGVTDGRIEVVNQTGEHEFAANTFFYVASANTAPQNLIAPPTFLYDRLEGQSRSRGNRGNESSETMARSGLNAESRPSEVPPPPQPSTFIVTEQRTSAGSPIVLSTVVSPTAAPVLVSGSGYGLAMTYATLPFNSNGQGLVGVPVPSATFDSSGQLIGYTDTSGATASLGTATVAPDFGNDGIIAWGRWTGGITLGPGTPHPQSFTVGNQSFQYVVGVPTPAADMARLQVGGLIGGYSLLGATTPSFSDGVGAGLGAGTVSGSLSVNFGTSTVTTNLVLTFPGVGGQIFSATSLSQGSFASGPAFQTPSNLLNATNTTNAAFCATGCNTIVSGFFAGPGAVRAGLVYKVTGISPLSAPGFLIVGSAAFKGPSGF